MVLQHPQEPREALSSTPLIPLLVDQARVVTALSVPNLGKLLTRAEVRVPGMLVPKRWWVLYLGSGMKSERKLSPGLYAVTKTGEVIQRDLEPPQGLILLDGTWSQAKTLWWRNAWLLKCQRAVLLPRARSLYGKMRTEPRPECLSTLETLAETLSALGEPAETEAALKKGFAALLDQIRLASEPARPV